VTNLDAFSNQRVEFAFLALNIANSDGAPACVLARPIR
jgi:kynurenine formamidase